MSKVLRNGINQIIKKYNIFTHRGIDIIKYKNKSAEVIAHSDGMIVGLVTGKKNDMNSKGMDSYGNYVKIKHANGMYTLYAHLKDVCVNKNSKVNRGSVLGKMGNSGNAKDTYLHFEVRNKNDICVNSTKYLDNNLPNLSENVKIIYQVYDLMKEKWLPINTSDYAGQFGNPISAIYINPLANNVIYQVHELNKEWVSPLNDDDYAGNIKKRIDGLSIKSKLNIIYRVHLLDFGWLPWIESNIGYAGIFGYEIDAIQINVKNKKSMKLVNL